MTANLEPDSVILRDAKGRIPVQILEQSYRADPVSQGLLLSLYEGKTIDFLVEKSDKVEIVQGKIVRSGYTPAPRNAQPVYGYPQQAPADQPIIEIDGKLRFGLPGIPIFPSLTDQTVLKPTLSWLLQSDTSGRVNGELSYVTSGLNWNAAYNVVAPETGDVLELIGWVTINNQTGKNFENSHVKLMAGEVNKIQQPANMAGRAFASLGALSAVFTGQPAVTEKSFDEYHLYELHQTTTLRDKETKQVEFTHASGIQSNRVYVYDGFKIDPMRYNGWDTNAIRQNAEYGTQSNPSVWVMREFANTKANQLGIPLPAGRMRFYRRDTDGHLEFTGENEIEHTPADETIRVYEGTAFDLVGERRQTNYTLKQNGYNGSVDESFEIKLRNHTKAPVSIRIVEHLYRGLNWTIPTHSEDFVKKDSRTMEFHVTVDPAVEKTLTYTVHYTW
ncbi:MAG TPA: DUF4139 domain-containing protein [Candidatus Acidoferrales bacterium]|nr:DUF4139 domain-containing protein [Candidatus Acidoferrales bacterium]